MIPVDLARAEGASGRFDRYLALAERAFSGRRVDGGGVLLCPGHEVVDGEDDQEIDRGGDDDKGDEGVPENLRA